MTKDDIIKMAREVGLVRAGDGWTEPARWGLTQIECFAALVAAAEREACAEICKPQTRWDDPLTAYEIARAIRARSQS